MMSKHPVAARRSPPAKPPEHEGDYPLSVEQPASGMFSFRYSSIEISATGSTAHVKRREARFENGKLKSEQFEGTIDRNVYDSYVRDFHDRLLRQTSLLMKSMLWFLPARSDEAGDRDR
jgi:hypothetical protein